MGWNNSVLVICSGGSGWGDRDGGRRDNGPLPTNDRWKEPARDDRQFDRRDDRGGYGGGRGGGGGGGRRDDHGGGGGGGRPETAEDWTKPLPRNERTELELFGGGHGPSGINFDRYEDIPVDATGNDVPSAIKEFSDITLTPIIQEKRSIISF